MITKRPDRAWLIGGGVAALLILVVGWFLFISPENTQTSAAQSQVSAARSRDQLLQVELTNLATQSKDLGKYEAVLSRAEQALPSSDGLPAFLRELQAIGASSLVNVSQLSVAAPVAPGPTTGASSTTPSTASSTGAATSGIYLIPITLDLTGSQTHLLQFLEQLQEVQPRAVLVSQANLGQASTAVGTGSTGLQLTLDAFVSTLPSSTATPGAAATPTPTPTAGG
jgi:Tfp pilus assembly protein PilO